MEITAEPGVKPWLADPAHWNYTGNYTAASSATEKVRNQARFDSRGRFYPSHFEFPWNLEQECSPSSLCVSYKA